MYTLVILTGAGGREQPGPGAEGARGAEEEQPGLGAEGARGAEEEKPGPGAATRGIKQRREAALSRRLLQLEPQRLLDIR